MIGFLEQNFKEVVSTAILILVVILLRYASKIIVTRYAKKIEILEHRKNLILKYNNIFIFILFSLSIFIIWGVKKEDIFFTISSIATVIGIAFFAQWSILSNITSGIIILFSFPFKIGDTIKIHDTDFPIEAELEYISTFYILLKTKEGEIITYPNNLLLQKGISIIKHRSEDKEFTD